MIKVARGDILLPFAVLSLLVMAAISVILVWTGGRLIEEEIRATSAQSVARTISPQVDARLQGVDVGRPLTGPDLEQFHAFVTASLISDETSLIRIRNDEGLIVYSSRLDEIGETLEAEPELGRAMGGETAAAVGQVAAEDDGGEQGSEVFTVFAPLVAGRAGPAAAVLEAEQDYGDIADAIVGARLKLYVGVGAAAAVLYLALQFAVWAAAGAFSRAYSRLSYLYRTGQQIRASMNANEVLSQIVRDATILVHGQYGLAVLREDDDGGGFMIKASYDHGEATVTQHHRKIDEWFLHRVTASKESLVAVEAAKPYGSVFGGDSIGGDIGLLGVPLSLPNKVLGVIVVIRKSRPFAFALNEVRMVDELVPQAAMALEQANLVAKISSHASELEVSYASTLKALMAAFDTREPGTEGHAERVTHLTLAVARQMGVPEERLIDLERGALLHDVGEISLPDSVLHKPEELTRKEWQAVEKHPLLAGLLVSKVGILEGALPILLYHHERFDGQGYPFGLAGDRIPLEARIFAVVDAYEAMTTGRPYRPAMSHGEAIAEIEANAFAQFDPAVTEAFKAVFGQTSEPHDESKQAA